MAALEWHQMTSINSIFQKTRSFVTAAKQMKHRFFSLTMITNNRVVSHIGVLIILCINSQMKVNRHMTLSPVWLMFIVYICDVFLPYCYCLYCFVLLTIYYLLLLLPRLH